MKTIFLILLSIITFITVHSQEWMLDYDSALQKAKDENKKIILVFSGSDWCGQCIKLKKSILQSEEFLNLVTEDYILLLADFPKKSKNKLSKEQQSKNNKLAEKYNKEGIFPLVVILNSKGDKLGSVGYKDTNPKDYFELIKKF